MRKMIVFVSLVFVIISCGISRKGSNLFTSIIYQDEVSMRINSRELFGVLSSNDLNGILSHELDGDKIAEGEVVNGHKNGSWIYWCYNGLNIYWDSDTIGDIIITTPRDWNYNSSDGKRTWYTFPIDSDKKNNKYFQLVELENVEGSLGEFAKQMRKDIENENQIVSSFYYYLNYDNGKICYYSVLLKIENNEEILILDALIEDDGRKYEVIYSGLNKELPMKNTIFFEVLKGVEINGKFILPPVSSIWKFENHPAD